MERGGREQRENREGGEMTEGKRERERGGRETRGRERKRERGKEGGYINKASNTPTSHKPSRDHHIYIPLLGKSQMYFWGSYYHT